MKIEGATLYTGKINGQTVRVKRETRLSDYGDPNGHPVPIEGIKIEAQKGGIITAEQFLQYSGLSRDDGERLVQVAKEVEKMTRPKPQAETLSKPQTDTSYECGRNSHESYLY